MVARDGITLPFNLEKFVKDASDGIDVLSLHSQLLDLILAPLFPWEGVTYARFREVCAAQGKAINEQRERDGTRELKGIYPLLFSNATGYRTDLKKLGAVLKEAVAAAEPAHEAFLMRIGEKLRAYPYTSDEAIKIDGVARTPLEHLREALSFPSRGGGAPSSHATGTVVVAGAEGGAGIMATRSAAYEQQAAVVAATAAAAAVAAAQHQVKHPNPHQQHLHHHQQRQHHTQHHTQHHPQHRQHRPQHVQQAMPPQGMPQHAPMGGHHHPHAFAPMMVRPVSYAFFPLPALIPILFPSMPRTACLSATPSQFFLSAGRFPPPRSRPPTSILPCPTPTPRCST